MSSKEQTYTTARGTARKALLTAPLLAVTSLTVMSLTLPAMAGMVTIDNFNNPDPGNLYVIATQQANPSVFVEQEPGIIGKEREFQITVNGTPNPFSALGIVMTGEYVFGSAAPGAKVIFQYDGDDQPGSGQAASGNLTNAKGINRNLGTENPSSKFLIEFLALDSGPTANHIDVEVRLTGAGNSTATYNGSIGDSNTAFDYYIPYSSFTKAGGFSFTQVTSLEFEFNTAMIPFVDFEIDRISAVPEPSTWALAVMGFAAMAMVARRRQRRSDG